MDLLITLAGTATVSFLVGWACCFLHMRREEWRTKEPPLTSLNLWTEDTRRRLRIHHDREARRREARQDFMLSPANPDR